VWNQELRYYISLAITAQHGSLVPVSSTHRCAYTPGLSTSSSSTFLQDSQGVRENSSRGELLQTPAAERVPSALKNIEARFQVPQVGVRLWGVSEAFANATYSQSVSDEVKQAAASYATPFVGASSGVEAVQWLQEPAQAASVALLPLRLSKDQAPFGLLVLASPDAQRFHSGMGTDLLEHLAELCSAALSALLPAKD